MSPYRVGLTLPGGVDASIVIVGAAACGTVTPSISRSTLALVIVVSVSYTLSAAMGEAGYVERDIRTACDRSDGRAWNHRGLRRDRRAGEDQCARSRCGRPAGH